MPWHLEEIDGEFCVIKDDDGSSEGCHASRSDALKQISALYASEADEDGEEATSGAFVLVPEGVWSGDGRRFEAGTTTWREGDLPMTANFGIPEMGGHGGAVIVGKWVNIRRQGNEIVADPIFDEGSDNGREAKRLVDEGMLRGVSVDAGIDPDGEVLTEEGVTFVGARIIGATLTPHPAFEGAGLIASATSLEMTLDDFTLDEPDELTPLTVTDDGRVFGHVAPADSCHIGSPHRCVTPPKSASEYALFRTGYVKLSDGAEIATGPVTIGGDHADRFASRTDAERHYADVSMAIADVTVVDGKFGPWASGRLRPGVTSEQVHALRASGWSGDWRPYQGGLELIAVHAVNAPGFPIFRAAYIAGKPASLVASVGPPCEDGLVDRIARLEHRERIREMIT